jgi:predicted MPP superfamily phosphohydrolase
MKNKKRWLIGLLVVVLMVMFLFWQNNDLVVTSIALDISIDEEITIVHLSDLHSKEFGENNKRLIEHVKNQEPDMIVITGDLVDEKVKEIENQLDYIEDLNIVAPVYIVLGNHEHWSGLYDEVVLKVETLGAKVMDNKVSYMNVYGHQFQLIGLSDPASNSDVKEELMNLVNVDMYNIVLYHRADMIDLFNDYDIELVFSGHAHGGQVRIPFIGGIYAPDQGLFPTYTSGLYEKDDTLMIVSRGLGNSFIPFRIFNRPEIVVVTLS